AGRPRAPATTCRSAVSSRATTASAGRSSAARSTISPAWSPTPRPASASAAAATFPAPTAPPSEARPWSAPARVADRGGDDEAAVTGPAGEAARLLDHRPHADGGERGRQDALLHHAQMGRSLLELGVAGRERQHLPAADGLAAIGVPVHRVHA